MKVGSGRAVNRPMPKAKGKTRLDLLIEVTPLHEGMEQSVRKPTEATLHNLKKGKDTNLQVTPQVVKTSFQTQHGLQECAGDFCDPQPPLAPTGVSYGISELFIGLGRYQLVAPALPDTSGTLLSIPKFPLASYLRPKQELIPSEGPGSGKNPANNRSEDLDELERKIVEMTSENENKGKKREPLLGQTIAKILRTVHKHNSAKVVAVCYACKLAYAKVAKKVISLLSCRPQPLFQ